MSADWNSGLTDADRYPTLTDAGRQMLRLLREHPNAPIYRNQSGNRLTAHEVEQARQFTQEVLHSGVGWREGFVPAWVPGFVERCMREVPHYRRYSGRPEHLAEMPTISRADLSRDIAQFVPDSLPLDRLLHFSTSGTTGHPLIIPSHPVVTAGYLAFHLRALRRFGVKLQQGAGTIGVMLLGWQRRCFTYVSVTPTMGEAGLAKINLHPDDWRDPDDRARYLNALAPEILSGDAMSFSVLLDLPVTTKPAALLSTSMSLLPGLRARLEERFQCPVLDLYSMNEAGPLAVADANAGGHVLLQHRMYVEILDERGQAVAPGTRGEITLTGGFNHCLPLLRYRTGDYASLNLDGPEPVLVELQGRPPVRFRTTAGEWINNLEVTHALGRFALAQFALHQAADGSLRLRFCGDAGTSGEIVRALRTLFGDEQQIDAVRLPEQEAKLIQYTSDLAGAQP